MQPDSFDLLASYPVHVPQFTKGHLKSKPIARRLFKPNLSPDRSAYLPVGQTHWPVKSKDIAPGNSFWRLRSLPGTRRPLQTTRLTPPRLSRIFTLLEQLATTDDSDDEEGDSSCFV